MALTKHGWEGVVLKAFGAKDFQVRAHGSRWITEDYLRVDFTGRELLEAIGTHPTAWIRVWFPTGGRGHQRAYTLVDPDPASGTFSLEFAMHRGPAADWARDAAAGDVLDVTIQGSAFRLPDPAPRRVHAVGDAAAVPGLNTLLDALGETPAVVFLEQQHESDGGIPLRLRSQDSLVWIPREDDGRRFVAEVSAAWAAGDHALDPEQDFVWIASESSAFRHLSKELRSTHRMARDRVDALGYWRA
ncbi:siderophore-interacting protein [Arthrobacter woluwensis]|uniref:NADPH-dependent ferric siderophore reductase, contains FAD-binding and SIP domains n=1 Tax=Arthrobacter woluwensis TaxID=156980 RepID=A0A1H4K9Y0_9MICC|nr:siderophore-interacting protein [Arthrobacter woluwensis]SEB55340.1 NADPH-dependent ferric siderophore reductase, contains FAD-binding and SIP domains [Arthrobacter woluwensis]